MFGDKGADVREQRKFRIARPSSKVAECTEVVETGITEMASNYKSVKRSIVYQTAALIDSLLVLSLVAGCPKKESLF